MGWRHTLRLLELPASLPLIALAAFAAWRSLERFHDAYLYNHGGLFTDDLSAGQINIGLEVEVWCLVLVTVSVSFMLLRFWRRSKAGRRVQWRCFTN